MGINIDKIIGDMTLEQKIGQMFMGNICGGESLDTAKRNFEKFHFGGLQFSGVFERFVRGGDYRPCGVCRNQPLKDVAKFIHAVKQASLEITGLPVIMGGDQEGCISGSIFRRRNFSIMPSQMGIGASGKVENAFAAASITAREIKTMGLDMLYGPSLDINTNPMNPEIGIRSFSENPDMVADFGEQIIRAYAEENLISNAKHFPGRGEGRSNAHHELETIDVNRARLDAVELVPFRRAIAAGVDSIMMAHTLFPALEKERRPASLSRSIITGLLREEMGFKGVIIPDTLTMFAISRNFKVPEACVMCFEAGADMIFMKVDELYEPVVTAIKEAVMSGRLSEENLNASLRRILELKRKRGLFAPAGFDPQTVSSVIGCRDHVETVTRLSREAQVLVRNEALLPITDAREKTVLAVVPRDMNVVLANDPVLSHEMLPRALGEHFKAVETMIVDEQPSPFQAYEAVGRGKNVDIVVFGIYSAGLDEEYARLLAELANLGKPVIGVITGSPYCVNTVQEHMNAILLTFGMSRPIFTAAAGIIAGVTSPGGTLPVRINETMGQGFSCRFNLESHAT